MRQWASTLGLAGAIALTLFACGRRDPQTASDGTSPGERASAPGRDDDQDGQAREGAKLNGYVEGYNTLLGTFGLSEQFRQYLGQNIPNKTLNDSVFVNLGWLDNGLTDLRKARAIPGGPGALNAAADPLIRSVDALVQRLKGLNIYYESRGQLQDDFARGKREDPLVVQDFRSSLAAMGALSDAIDREQDRRDARQLDAMKAAGDRIGYDASLALLRAKALVRLFPDDGALRDDGRFRQGDGLVGQIQAALDDERAEHAKPHEVHDAEEGVRDSMEEEAADRLEGMIGRYRELERSRAPFGRQMMISAYNDAIDQHNHGQV